MTRQTTLRFDYPEPEPEPEPETEPTEQEPGIIERKKESREKVGNEFDPDEVPEFYGLAERVNEHLVEMAKQGVIKYGERGELKGQVRLDLRKTFPYYREIEGEDPIAAWTLKNVMDEWRQQHTGRHSWISANRAFGMGQKEVEDMFSDRVECATEAVKLRKKKAKLWNQSVKCSVKLRDMEHEIKRDLRVQRENIDREWIKNGISQKIKDYAKRNRITGRQKRTMLNHINKNWRMKKEDTQEKYKEIRQDFFRENYHRYIKPEYHDEVTPGIESTRELRQKITDKKLQQMPEYTEKERQCQILDEKHKEARKKLSEHRYEKCGDELKAMEKETKSFANWMGKEILRNLWRE